MSGDSGTLKELEHCVSSQDAWREACSVMYNGAIQIWRDRNHGGLALKDSKKSGNCPGQDLNLLTDRGGL
jgi:hypothetical protein